MSKWTGSGTPEFMAKVALVALKEEETRVEIAERFEIHPNMVSLWKRDAVEGMQF